MSEMTITLSASPVTISLERSLAQSPIPLDALRALARPSPSKFNMRAARPLLGLGFSFLPMEMPSIHHVLGDASSSESASEDSPEHPQSAAILSTPACEALFDTPYVDALFDVLSPEVRSESYVEERISQAFWALVAVMQWYFQPFFVIVAGLCLTYHGTATLLQKPKAGLNAGGRTQTAVLCALCPAFVALVVFATVGFSVFSCFART